MPAGAHGLLICSECPVLYNAKTLRQNKLTSRLDCLVVGLTDELFIVHQIEFVSSVKLAAAH